MPDPILTPDTVATIRNRYRDSLATDVYMRRVCDSHEALRAEVARLTAERDEESKRKRLESEVAALAIQWWDSRCPLSMTRDEHRKQPWLNLSSKSENALARAVSRLLDSRDSDAWGEQEQPANLRPVLERALTLKVLYAVEDELEGPHRLDVVRFILVTALLAALEPGR